jgi:hypothetical protein
MWFLLAVGGLFVLGFSGATAAARSPKASPLVKVRIIAPQTGREAFLMASLVRENIAYSPKGKARTQLVYEALVPTKVLSSLVDSKQRWDSTYAVKVTIKMYYDQIYQGGYEFTNAHQYQTRWDVYDYSVSLHNAVMRAGANGEKLDGSQFGEHSVESPPFSPSTGQVYTLQVPWNEYINTTTNEFGYQAGYSEVTLQRGLARWNLSICIYKGSCGQYREW